MAGRIHLYVPGPTNVPQSGLNAINVAIEDHRSPTFPKLLKSLLAFCDACKPRVLWYIFIWPHLQGEWQGPPLHQFGSRQMGMYQNLYACQPKRKTTNQYL